MCVRVYVCFLSRLNASSLISFTPTLFFFPLPLCLFSPQDTEPEQDSHGRSGRLQFVLYAALAVRPVCAAHSGKQRASVGRKEKGQREKIETWREQRILARKGAKSWPGWQRNKAGKTERKRDRHTEITKIHNLLIS